MKPNCFHGRANRHRGAIAVLIAITLPILLAVIVFFMGIAQIQLARSELRVCADSAARAATESILRSQDEESAYQQTLEVTRKHFVSNQSLTLDQGALVFGQGLSHPGAEWEFFPGQRPYNAAQVTVAVDGQTQSGPGQLLLSMFGMAQFESSKMAIASQIDHDIVFVIEAGGSMHAPQRWKGVMAAFDQVVKMVKTLGNRTRVGIVVCHKDPLLTQNLVEVSGQFLVRLNEIHDQVSDVKLIQGRNLGGGLELASNILEAEKKVNITADQTIVFLGNGHHNKGTEPVHAGRLAASRGQVIYCLVFGHNSDKDGNMESAALVTGGKFFDVQDLSLLPEILTEVIINPSIVLIR